MLLVSLCVCVCGCAFACSSWSSSAVDSSIIIDAASVDGHDERLELFDLLVLARVVVHLKVELAEHLVLLAVGRHEYLL